MIKYSILLLIFLIALIQGSYSQTSTGTNTCLTARQVKIINLVFNELDRNIAMNAVKDSIIGTAEQKISILTYQRDLRTDQVVELQTALTTKEVECKKLHRLVIFWQVITGAAVLSLILLR